MECKEMQQEMVWRGLKQYLKKMRRSWFVTSTKRISKTWIHIFKALDVRLILKDPHSRGNISKQRFATLSLKFGDTRGCDLLVSRPSHGWNSPVPRRKAPSRALLYCRCPCSFSDEYLQAQKLFISEFMSSVETGPKKRENKQ